jgi:PAS domain S-box-containing protein
MVEAGHVLIGTAGEFLSMDAAFCGIMRLSEDEMRGRLVLDVTAPADRMECATAIQQLRDTGRPFEITKRFMRDDGSLVWVKNTVSITIGEDRPGMIVATIEPVSPRDARGPALLLDMARLHINARRNRESVCDPMFFSDSGWDTILAIYVAEAEGRSIDTERLAGLLGKSIALTDRWITALLRANVLEIEYANPQADTTKAYRLTAATHAKLEVFLARDHRTSAAAIPRKTKS